MSDQRTVITRIEDIQAAIAQRPKAPASDLDKAIEGYQKAAREHRECRDRRERLRREHSAAEDAHIAAGKALQEARERLSTALDAEQADVPR